MPAPGSLIVRAGGRDWDAKDADKLCPQNLERVGWSGGTNSNRLLWIGFDLDVGHGNANYESTDTALVGLRRLLCNDRFTEPVDSVMERAKYRQECNPARTFLEENCEIDTACETPTQMLYQNYVTYVESCGCKPLCKATFGREVHRQFPSVTWTKNAVKVETPHGNVRDRKWLGLKFMSS